METEIILHRGYKGRYLENSFASFENAIRKDMSFETDIRVDKDGKCFLIHDEYLDRLFSSCGKIQSYTSLELKELRYKRDNSHLVSLNEFFDLIRKRKRNSGKIFIHIKQLEDIHKFFSSLNFDLASRLRFFACDDITWGLVNIIRKDYQKHKVGLHVTEDSPYKYEEYFKKVDFIWADEITKKNITPELVSLAHNSGKPIYVISPELISESVFNQNIKKMERIYWNGGRWNLH